MSITINSNTNMSSLIAQVSLTRNTNSLSSVMEKLSTGYKVNRASDDAAGLALSINMQTEMSKNKKASDNINTAINMLTIVEGTYDNITNIMMRIKNLANQAANDFYTKESKEAIVNEIKSNLDEIDRLSKSTNFNGLKLLDGSANNLSIQIGTGSAQSLNSINIGDSLINAATSAGALNIAIGVLSAGSISADFAAYMSQIEVSLNTISAARSKLGAYENRMTSTDETITLVNEGLAQSRSTIMDTDVAAASSDLVKYQILQQSTSYVLQQANIIPQTALSLIQ